MDLVSLQQLQQSSPPLFASMILETWEDAHGPYEGKKINWVHNNNSNVSLGMVDLAKFLEPFAAHLSREAPKLLVSFKYCEKYEDLYVKDKEFVEGLLPFESVSVNIYMVVDQEVLDLARELMTASVELVAIYAVSMRRHRHSMFPIARVGPHHAPRHS